MYYLNKMPILFSGQGGASFSPPDIADLIWWLDASDSATITETAGSVSQWDDKSTSGYNVVQGTGASQPITGTRTLNGLNVLDIEINDYLSGSANSALLSTLGSDNHTIFVLCSVDDNTASRSIIRGMNASNNTRYFIGIRPDPAVEVTFNTNTTSYSGAMSTGTAHILAAYKDVGGSPSAKFIFNGNSTSGSGSDGSIVNIGIGRRTNSAVEQWDGTVAEIILYNRVLSTSEINQVGNYLETKWGATWTDI